MTRRKNGTSDKSNIESPLSLLLLLSFFFLLSFECDGNNIILRFLHNLLWWNEFKWKRFICVDAHKVNAVQRAAAPNEKSVFFLSPVNWNCFHKTWHSMQFHFKHFRSFLVEFCRLGAAKQWVKHNEKLALNTQIAFFLLAKFNDFSVSNASMKQLKMLYLLMHLKRFKKGFSSWTNATWPAEELIFISSLAVYLKTLNKFNNCTNNDNGNRKQTV